MAPAAPSRPPACLAVPERIEGERIVLRPYVATDAPTLQRVVNGCREHLHRMPWAATAHRTDDDSFAFIVRATAWWIQRENLILGIFERTSGTLLGGTGLHPCRGTSIDWSIPALMIGYWIAPEHEGKGFVTEAVRLLTRVAFGELGAQRLEIRCDADNGRSERVMIATGFTREGLLRNDARTSTGELRSTLLYSLTPEEYARSHTAPPITTRGSPTTPTARGAAP